MINNGNYKNSLGRKNRTKTLKNFKKINEKIFDDLREEIK